MKKKTDPKLLAEKGDTTLSSRKEENGEKKKKSTITKKRTNNNTSKSDVKNDKSRSKQIRNNKQFIPIDFL